MAFCRSRLTGWAAPTIVKRGHPSELMAKSAAIRELDTRPKWRLAPRWQIALCLLLTALVIYNPYLAGAESGPGLCVRHSASNRATVGASELQHFSPINSRSILATATVVVFQLFDGLLNIASQPHERTEKPVLPAIQHLPASLWFRPPPAC
jgi:hypothetical protein